MKKTNQSRPARLRPDAADWDVRWRKPRKAANAPRMPNGSLEGFCTDAEMTEMGTCLAAERDPAAAHERSTLQ
jgi:hypothetical protein